MSLKQEIENWVEALKYYDDQNYDKALEIFEKNADTSKLWFNVGMIYATLGEHERAVCDLSSRCGIPVAGSNIMID